MVVTGIVDPVAIMDIMDLVDITDLIAAATVAPTRKIHTRIALARVLTTQRPMSPCTVSARRFHLRRGRRDFLLLKPNTRPRKPCTAPRSRPSE
jgi:hypothetical protein